MATPSLARPGHETNGRVERGRALYLDHADEIRFEGGVWFVPSQHDATSVYEVRLARAGDDCECIDFERSGLGYCKHVIAATIAKAKTAPCAGCGRRFRHGDLYEVTEDHGSLAFFVGDAVCEGCGMAHGIL